VSIWNTETRELLATLPVGRNSVWCAAWSLDHRLAVGFANGEAVAWDIPAIRRELDKIGLAWNKLPPKDQPMAPIVYQPPTVDERERYARAYVDRAGKHVVEGGYENAIADLDKAVEFGASNMATRYRLALAQLGCGNVLGYQETCKRSIGALVETTDRAAESEEDSAGDFAVWAATLFPDALAEYEEAIELARSGVEADPDNAFARTTLGAILLRGGKTDIAIDELTTACQFVAKGLRNEDSSFAYTWYLLAITHHKAGNEEQAREYLNKANQWTDKVLGDEDNPPTWNRQATLELFRKEAEALLVSDDEESADSGTKSEGKSNTKSQVEQDQEPE
jgi:tetratricopeptide (TPR) repeat protein